MGSSYTSSRNSVGNTYSIPYSATRSRREPITAPRTAAGSASKSRRNRPTPSSQKDAGNSLVVMNPCGNDCSMSASKPNQCLAITRSSWTLRVREMELQRLMATPEGRRELEDLAARYQDAGGRMRPEKTSVITYILVHERQKGLIIG